MQWKISVKSLRGVDKHIFSLQLILVVLVICSRCCVAADICGEAPRSLFTLRANITADVFKAEVETLRRKGYTIVVAMAGLKMIVGCGPNYMKAASNSSTAVAATDIGSKTIVHVEEDGIIFTAGEKESWALDRMDQPRLPLDRYHYDPRNCSSSLGAGVDVYIIDTGCETEHKAFQGRSVRSEAAPGSGYAGDGSDNNGHGTAVASLVVGRDTGAAAGANVTCIKALNGRGKGRFSDVISALNVAVERRKSGGAGRGTFAVLSLAAEDRKTHV